MVEPSVFVEYYSLKTYPKWCLCGCGIYDRLFTEEAQLKNKERGVYRQFANGSHLKMYLQSLKLP